MGTDGKLKLVGGGKILLSPAGRRMLVCCCGFVQAKKCSDSSDVDLWFPLTGGTVVGITYFSITPAGTTNTTYYYVDETCNVSNTPGTLAAGYVFETSCRGCARCNLAQYVKEYTVTVAGVTVCGCGSGFAAYVGTVNGTYTARVNTACIADVVIAGLTWKTYSGSGCTGSVLSSVPVHLQIALGTGVVSILAEGLGSDGADYVFRGTFAAGSNCLGSITVNNTNGTSCVYPDPAGHGGTITFTPKT